MTSMKVESVHFFHDVQHLGVTPSTVKATTPFTLIITITDFKGNHISP